MKSFFDKVYQQLFSQATQTQSPVKILLKRSETDIKAYQDWFQKNKYQELLVKIKKAYALHKIEETETKPDIYLLDSPYAKGFAVVFDKNLMQKKSLQFLMEYFKDKTRELGYVVKNAQKNLREKSNYIETIEKYYLKPSIKISMQDPAKANQLYGNISLENILRDNKPSMLKVLVTIYSDQLFTDALNYQEYVDFLFE